MIQVMFLFLLHLDNVYFLSSIIPGTSVYYMQLGEDKNKSDKF